jgi:hypothetical protein
MLLKDAAVLVVFNAVYASIYSPRSGTIVR